ncbi:MAG TPA: hypothetical protein VLX92_01620 [Kofleriaceae bacterium]|nr:hypothetical protein [Kofleriaceae bacterium]
MPTPVIVERVRDLYDKLSETQPDAAVAPTLDPVKQALETIRIEPHEPAHYRSLNDLLLLAYVKIEVSHPELAHAMTAVINAMNAAGI